MTTKIAASVLNADLSIFGKEILRAEQANVDMIHLDVMDGAFVESMTFGDYVVKSLRKYTKLPFDTHLMVNDPTNLISRFANAGSDSITIHEESNCNVKMVLRSIRACGLRAGLSIKPNTPADKIYHLLPDVDMVLVMTVEPGKGGQEFMMEMLPKISAIRKAIQETGRAIDLQVDGGINESTAALCRQAGANVLVAGTYLFASADMREAVQKIR